MEILDKIMYWVGTLLRRRSGSAPFYISGTYCTIFMNATPLSISLAHLAVGVSNDRSPVSVPCYAVL